MEFFTFVCLLQSPTVLYFLGTGDTVSGENGAVMILGGRSQKSSLGVDIEDLKLTPCPMKPKHFSWEKSIEQDTGVTSLPGVRLFFIAGHCSSKQNTEVSHRCEEAIPGSNLGVMFTRGGIVLICHNGLVAHWGNWLKNCPEILRGKEMAKLSMQPFIIHILTMIHFFACSK